MVDAFSKFTWIFPTKTLTSQEVIDKLILTEAVFGNPRRIITDKGAAFRFQDFKDYCSECRIDHEVTTGMPRGNGQAENRVQTFTSSLRKLSAADPTKFY